MCSWPSAYPEAKGDKACHASPSKDKCCKDKSLNTVFSSESSKRHGDPISLYERYKSCKTSRMQQTLANVPGNVSGFATFFSVPLYYALVNGGELSKFFIILQKSVITTHLQAVLIKKW